MVKKFCFLVLAFCVVLISNVSTAQVKIIYPNSDYFKGQNYSNAYPIEHVGKVYPDSMYDNSALMGDLLNGNHIYPSDSFGLEPKGVVRERSLRCYVDSTQETIILKIKKAKKNSYRYIRYYPNGNVRCEGLIKVQDSAIIIDVDTEERLSSNFEHYQWAQDHVRNQFVAFGEWVTYHENGKILSKGEYSGILLGEMEQVIALDLETIHWLINEPGIFSSLKSGPWFYFNSNGEQILYENYTNGKVTNYAYTP